ncbi:MAG: hypothetical protein PHX47_02590 [Candidatus ainarchaeum sp.]|nr:hypothetical protein [Candidatus ainarchaeum sp.]
MNRQEQKEFNLLKKENNDLRQELKLYLFNLAIPERDINHIFLKINGLIENEIKQETYTNL